MRSLRWSEEPEELDRYQPVPQHCVAYWKRTFSHKEGQSGSNPEHATNTWKIDRGVYGGTLLRCCTRKGTVGSNPTSSAKN
jgi:hypothetical protein